MNLSFDIIILFVNFQLFFVLTLSPQVFVQASSLCTNRTIL